MCLMNVVLECLLKNNTRDEKMEKTASQLILHKTTNNLSMGIIHYNANYKNNNMCKC